MNKIQKVSSYLIHVFNIILIGYPILFTLQWVFKDWALVQNALLAGLFTNEIQTPEGLVHLSSLNFTPLSWGIGYAAGIIGFIPLFLGLIILKRLFQNYTFGSIFSLENVKKYQYLGWLFFLNALFITPLSDMLMVLSATLSNPPGHRYLSITFGTPNLEDILYGLLIIVISWVMAEGYKIKEEQNLTI